MNSLRNVTLFGFGTFGKYAANSGEQAIKTVVKRHLPGVWVSDWQIFQATIPEYDRGREALEVTRRKGADAAICLGMASDRVGFCVETRAKNLIDDTRYCPEQSGLSVDPSMALNEVDLDIRQWDIDRFAAACAAEGLPRPSRSFDAGGFCCNHLMIQLYAAAKRDPRLAGIPWIFLHVPCSEEAVRPKDLEAFVAAGKSRMRLDDIVKGLEIFMMTATPVRKRETVAV